MVVSLKTAAPSDGKRDLYVVEASLNSVAPISFRRTSFGAKACGSSDASPRDHAARQRWWM